MANITGRQFHLLDPSGQNYVERRKEALDHLKAYGLENTISENNNSSSEQDKAKAMIFLRRHLHESFYYEFLRVNDPKELWDTLSERFRLLILHTAQNDWLYLRFQDFESVSEYNKALQRITARLEFCGQKICDVVMIEKTLSTMHPSNMVLHQMYRLQGYKKFSDLLSVLLVAEQNNELFMKNQKLRPRSFKAF